MAEYYSTAAGAQFAILKRVQEHEAARGLMPQQILGPLPGTEYALVAAVLTTIADSGLNAGPAPWREAVNSLKEKLA